MIRALAWIAATLVGAAFVTALVLGLDILVYASRSESGPADAAIVLGAAVAGDEPTPVFEERLRHAVSLYETAQVPLLVMTGGKAPGDTLAESEAGRACALAHGVPPDAIVIETDSHTTEENFIYARPLLAGAGAERVLVVSDPLHMRRAMRMAEDIGLDAHPSPTPTSRYRTLSTQIPMLAREIWFTLHYLVAGRIRGYP